MIQPVNVNQHFNFLKNLFFFRNLSDNDIAKIQAVCNEEEYEAGAIIFSEGSIGDKFFIVLEGVVEIWKNYIDETCDLLAIYGPGHMFGEMALIDDLPRSATVVSKERCRLLSINHVDFKQIITDNSSISLSIMKSISLMIRSSTTNFIEDLRIRNKQLVETQKKMQEEIEERKRIQEELKAHRDHLEVLIKERTADLIKTNKQLQQSQRLEAIGTLAGGIAHNFNNLLMGIQGNVSLMIQDCAASNVNYEELKSIEKCVESGANLTKQLLGFARGGKYVVKPTNLNEIAAVTAEMFGRTKKGIKIKGHYAPEIWTTEVDQRQIEIVLLNLYVNADQAMPDGGNLTISTANVFLDEHDTKPYGVEPGKYVRIAVQDDGIGMNEETRQKAFEPFFTTKEVGKGTGLGLASAFGIIKNHDGIIRFTTKEMRGTTFEIYLPANDKLFKSSMTPPEDLVPGNETILLVDDEEIIVEVSEPMLKQLGYKVITANGGQQAIDIFSLNLAKIDLVILDIIMPGVDGRKVYKKLIELKPSIKVLFSSGYIVNAQGQLNLRVGYDGIIQKPFNMIRLSRKIRELFDAPNGASQSLKKRII